MHTNKGSRFWSFINKSINPTVQISYVNFQDHNNGIPEGTGIENSYDHNADVPEGTGTDDL
jgi:hypothetical protein